MGLPRAAPALIAAVAAGLLAVSGGSEADPRTPAGLPGLPPPLTGVAVVGGGGRTTAVDAYGNVVDLRAPGPAGEPLVAVSAKRQAAGTAHGGEALIARARLDGGRVPPLWRADSVRQRYLPRTNVLVTVARFGDERTVVVRRHGGRGAAERDRRWLSRARPLGGGAPAWARRLYERSLLVLRALTDQRTGAVAAGARDGWAYVWPRDAGAVAIAYAAAGYRPEAQRVAQFLLGLDLGAAARFRGSGEPVPGRPAQGDAEGWTAAAARAAGLSTRPPSQPWRNRADYREGTPGDHLANAIATSAADGPKSRRGLYKSAHRRGRLDSALAWAVRPFRRAELVPAARRGMLELAEASGRYGILPSEDWSGGEDPWTAPTAWTAWGLAALAREDARRGRQRLARRERRAALRLVGTLRRAATPLGLLPERVDAESGEPRSTTPLAWSHAFAILALHELWP